MKQLKKQFSILFLLISIVFTACGNLGELEYSKVYTKEASTLNVKIDGIPDYDGRAYIELDGNIPSFNKKDGKKNFESYSELDDLGRCGVAYANIGLETMPNEPRGSIGAVRPSGWHTVKYDIVDGKYLYNRCHLIGFQLAGENANEKNLITGTRYMNTIGMLPFENEIADYVKNTGNHVLYRVTPVFNGDNLVADGVRMEAYSVEDEGRGVSFNVFCYNVQPGVHIDYRDGNSHLDGEEVANNTSQNSEEGVYILNKSSKKFHRSNCISVSKMKPKNRTKTNLTRDEIVRKGYEACDICKP